jgi:hypothetical protein
MNESKHRQLMAILNKKGFDADSRHELIYSFTDGRTKSTRELYDLELTQLVNELNKIEKASGELALQLALKEKRAIVLAIAQRVGIHEGTNFDKFNAFMEARSILKKRLNKYTIDELDQLIKQFRGLEANFTKSAENAGTKAWNKANGFSQLSDN